MLQIIDTNESHRLVLPESMLPPSWDGVLIFRVLGEYLGVAEFSAPEGCVVVPRTLLAKHNLELGEKVQIVMATLPLGTRITLESTDAIDWKHVLETYLPKNYSALQAGQEIAVDYGGVKRAIVTKCEPEDAICIINTDLDLDLNVTESEAVETKVRTLRGRLQIEGLAFIGPVGATSENSYFERVVDSIYLAEEPVDVVGDALVKEAQDGEQGAAAMSQPGVASDGSSRCPICSKQVPPSSMIPHQAFCARNTKKCECGTTFTGSIPSNHWHCACGHVETSDFRQSHDREHTPETCACGYEGPFKEVALHRTRECPLKPILCQFCHLLQPQGTASAVDRLSGLTEHEAACGAKTVDCPICRKIVLVRNLASHMAHHEQLRKDRAILSPTICANVNCPNLVAAPGKAAPGDQLGLCSHCFGLVYAPGNDPDGSKLKGRLERRYVLQLTRGCGNAWCTNPQCASASGVVLGFKDAMARASGMDGIYLCVDKTTTRRNMFLEEEPEFSAEWKGMAITTCGSEAEARTWLQNNAPRADGS